MYKEDICILSTLRDSYDCQNGNNTWTFAKRNEKQTKTEKYFSPLKRNFFRQLKAMTGRALFNLCATSAEKISTAYQNRPEKKKKIKPGSLCLQGLGRKVNCTKGAAVQEVRSVQTLEAQPHPPGPFWMGVQGPPKLPVSLQRKRETLMNNISWPVGT